MPLGDRVIVPRIAADLENAIHSSVLAKINLHQVAWRMSGRPGSTSQRLNADFEGLGALIDQFWRIFGMILLAWCPGGLAFRCCLAKAPGTFHHRGDRKSVV